MLLYAVRFAFVLLVLALTMTYISNAYTPGSAPTIHPTWMLLGASALALVMVIIEWLMPRKGLRALGGLFFGLLVGMVIAYALSLIVDLVADTMIPQNWPTAASHAIFIGTIKLLIGVITCYFTISFVLQTMDDIRFIIPYVEFSKQAKGTRPIVLDTSTIIDGRIADVCETGILDAPLIVPRFVLQELQSIADSPDRLRRNRGRRGLDVLNRLQRNEKIDVELLEPRWARKEQSESVDHKLIMLARELDARLITTDYNLAKVAQLRGIEVINLNDLANALKPAVLPGEEITVKIIRPGEEPTQGVGYLEDGTMVVVEGGRDKIGQEVAITVTSVLQTSAGRMLFGRTDDAPPPQRTRSKRGNGPRQQRSAERRQDVSPSQQNREAQQRESNGKEDLA